MDKKVRSFWGWLLAILSSSEFKDALVKLLKKNVIKLALKKLAIVGGIKAWLVSFVIEELVEEADEHLIEPAFRKVGYLGDYLDGAKVYKKVLNAEDVDEWLDAINSV